MKNWKTTSAGIIMIVGGLVRLGFAFKSENFTEEAIMTSVTAVTAGVGFLLAKDNDVTGV